MSSLKVEIIQTPTPEATCSSSPVSMTVPTPHENKAQVLFGPKTLRLISRPIAPPGPDEVQVAIRSTTLCGSDVHYFTHFANGDIQIQEPLSQGHESSGEVVALGANVKTLRVGDRVALEVGLPCSGSDCEDCQSGQYNLCQHMRFRSSAASFPHLQGTLQERLNHPARWCHRLPEELSYDAGALLEPLSMGVHALKKVNLKPGASVLVIGAGAVGLMCAAVAKAEGCGSVTMTDIAANRLEFAQKAGFANAVSLVPLQPQSDAPSTIQKRLQAAMALADEAVVAKENAGLPAGKFHATFECTGVESCVQTSIYATRPGGKILLIGMGTPIQTLPVSAAALREVDIFGVWRYANTYPRALEIMQAAGKPSSNIPNIQSILTHRFQGLESVPKAFATAAKTTDEGGNLVIKVVVNN